MPADVLAGATPAAPLSAPSEPKVYKFSHGIAMPSKEDHWADENHGIGTTLGDANEVVAKIHSADEDEKGPHILYWSTKSLYNKKLLVWSV